MENNFDLKKFLVENKLTTNSKLLNEAMTIVGNTPEEVKKNAEDMVTLATQLGFEATIEYNNGIIYGVEVKGSGKTQPLRDLQTIQFAAYKQPDNGNTGKDGKKLKKAIIGGETYEIGDSDPNDDGRIETIEKYANGYAITGGIYSDYGDGDDAKETYIYAIDFDGNEMDEEDLEGRY